MSHNQPSDPVFTHRGIAEMINDPNTNMEDIAQHVQNLAASAVQLEQDNLALRNQLEAQAHALQDPTNGPLLNISATLQAVVNAQREAQRIHQENQESQRAYQANMADIFHLMSQRSFVAGTGRLATPLPFTDKFKGPDGDMSFTVFKAQLQAQTSRFPQALKSDEDRITYAFQCMSGAPSRYIALYYNGELQDTEGFMTNYNLFMTTIDRLFGDQDNREECEHKLLRLRQGNTTFNDYLIRFRELASRTQWNDASLRARFKDGLSFEIKQILAVQWNRLNTIEEVVAAAATAAQNLRTRDLFRSKGQSSSPHQHQQAPRRHQTTMVQPSSSGAGPMDLDAVSVKKISHEERQRRLSNKLCLYCGGAGHQVAGCPVKKPIQANVVAGEDSGNEEAED